MKQTLLLIISGVMAAQMAAQTTTQNYIVTTIATDKVSNPANLVDDGSTSANANSTIGYFDGLGRSSQTVRKAITPSATDLVSGVMYDVFGRESQQWLPGAVANNAGAFVSGFGTSSVSTNGDGNPYATTNYEASPLNRVIGQYGPRADWYNNNKGKTTAYLTNGSDVKLFVANSTVLTCAGNYASGTLYGVQTTDEDGRVVQTRATNHLSGYDITYNAIDFPGKPTATYKTHGISGASTTYTELYSYTYDKAERLLTATHSLNGGTTVTLVSNSYDALGRVSTKTLGGIDASTYSYNVRSWISGITGSRFAENLYYNNNTANLPNFTASYNGNIAGMQWNIAAESLGYNRAYSFSYDGLNRLITGLYCGFNGSVVSGTADRYDETFGYDKMGNITNFARWGLQYSSPTMTYAQIDNLVLSHTGNQLTHVTETGNNGIYNGNEEFQYNQYVSGNSCAYDANGNRLYDSNSNVWRINYNVLNLPDAMQFCQGHQTYYTYTAAGTKLQVVDKMAPEGTLIPASGLNAMATNITFASTTATDYVGNYIYATDQYGTRSLLRILLPEGYYQGGYYYYYLKDHLGSNRVALRSDGYVAETSSYYPSGMRFGESVVNGGNVQPYRHIGKEMQSMHGLNWYDNLARFRTVSDGSGFTSVDPLAEKYYRWSPYVYAVDNFMRFTDNDGGGPQDRVKKAYSMIGTSYFREMSYALRTQQTPEALRYMDCAEFVCRVLAADQITNGVKHMNSSSLQSYLNNKNQFILSQSPQIGDIALWDGHVGIVTGIGKHGAIKLTHASGHLHGAIENPIAIDPSIYRPGSKFYGYYRPIIETRDGKLDGEEDEEITQLDEVTIIGKRKQNQSSQDREWQEYIKQQNEANSAFQRGRPHEGDYNYRGSFWQAYDDTKNLGNNDQKNQLQP